MTDRVLINTAKAYDAGLLGFEGPADFAEDGQGLKLAVASDGWFTLNGPDGEVNLSPTQARHLAHALFEEVAKSNPDHAARIESRLTTLLGDIIGRRSMSPARVNA